MHSMFNHPVLQEMLSAKCCSEKSAGLGFALYSSLCEGYRLRNVGWRCCEALDLIYTVSSSTTALQVSPPIAPPVRSPSSASKRSKTHPQNEQKKFAALKLSSETPEFPAVGDKDEKKQNQDAKISESEPSRCSEKQVPEVSSEKLQLDNPEEGKSETFCGSSSDACKIGDAVAEKVEGDVQIPGVQHVQGSSLTVEDISSKVEENVEIVCVPVLCDCFLEDSFLRRIHSTVMRMYPHAKLSLVPMDRWRVLGNYAVTDGIDASSDIATRTKPTDKNSAERPSDDKNHTDKDLQASSPKLVSFPEAYIMNVCRDGEQSTRKQLENQTPRTDFSDTVKTDKSIDPKPVGKCGKLECTSVREDDHEHEWTTEVKCSADNLDTSAVRTGCDRHDEWGATESWDDV